MHDGSASPSTKSQEVKFMLIAAYQSFMVNKFWRVYDELNIILLILKIINYSTSSMILSPYLQQKTEKHGLSILSFVLFLIHPYLKLSSPYSQNTILIQVHRYQIFYSNYFQPLFLFDSLLTILFYFQFLIILLIALIQESFLNLY